MKKLIVILLPAIILGCSGNNGKNLTDYVNPFIGTDGHGHTFPGATLPFGMVQLSPDTRIDDWDGCSGYHYSDSSILGFSHTHLSGTGVGDYGDIRFMPMAGKLHLKPGPADVPEDGYRSRFSHREEEASPGYYRVFLKDYQIDAEMTATPRCGFHRYTFAQSGENFIVIDLKESIVSETNLRLFVEVVNDREIRGYRKSSGWAHDQAVFFHAIFSRPFLSAGIALDGAILQDAVQAEGNDIQAYVSYQADRNSEIMVKVGISPVSMEGARNNLAHEIPGWDFDETRRQAKDEWSKELAKIEIEGGDHADRVKFYTALYHACIAPNLFTDADGSYKGHDGQVHRAEGFNMYTVFSLWDTYRALHPLLAIIQPDRTIDFIRSFIDIYEKGGLLPVWELAGNETFCMIGYHSVPVIADVYLNGLRGFDVEKAYDAMLSSASGNRFGLDAYRRFGYIPAEMEGEAVSRTLEYAYDDWCIAMMAKALGREADFREYIERAQSYKNLFDPATGFIRGKRNGMFVEPFDPTEVNFMLTEANTWQYTFYVPQDISGLIGLMGGDEGFERKLDEMFAATDSLSGRRQADITGLIGQYAHGNEPSHHMAYLYNYSGKPAKTQKLVRQIMEELYGDGPDGLCGNEDCGQMSAWYLLSAMGFYPVTPASGIYAIGSPLFDRVTLHLADSKTFTIRTIGNNPDNIYIQSAELNGQEYPKSYLRHMDIMEGGEILFRMGSRPDFSWGAGEADRPVSRIMEYLITPVPYFEAPGSSFQEDLTIGIKHIDPESEIFYQAGDLFSAGRGSRYTAPFTIRNSTSFSAVASSGKTGPGKMASASFYRIGHNWKVSVKYPYNSQYTGGGDMALIDGQRGGANFRTGSWQGYHGVDLEAVIDMGQDRSIGRISASFLQDQKSWIFMPTEVTFQVSSKPYDFRTVAIIKNDTPEGLNEAVIREFDKKALKAYGRYIRVIAHNRGVCPDWHIGAGERAWIFIDEIMVE